MEDHLQGAKHANVNCNPESAVLTACRLNLQPQVNHSAMVWHSGRHMHGPCLHQGYQGIRLPGLMSRTRLRHGVNGLPFRQGSTEPIAHEVQGLQSAHILPFRRQPSCNGACTRLHQWRCKGVKGLLLSRPRRLNFPSADHEGGSSPVHRQVASTTGMLASRAESCKRRRR